MHMCDHTANELGKTWAQEDKTGLKNINLVHGEFTVILTCKQCDILCPYVIKPQYYWPVGCDKTCANNFKATAASIHRVQTSELEILTYVKIYKILFHYLPFKTWYQKVSLDQHKIQFNVCLKPLQTPTKTY